MTHDAKVAQSDFDVLAWLCMAASWKKVCQASRAEAVALPNNRPELLWERPAQLSTLSSAPATVLEGAVALADKEDLAGPFLQDLAGPFLQVDGHLIRPHPDNGKIAWRTLAHHDGKRASTDQPTCGTSEERAFALGAQYKFVSCTCSQHQDAHIGKVLRSPRRDVNRLSAQPTLWHPDAAPSAAAARTCVAPLSRRLAPMLYRVGLCVAFQTAPFELSIPSKLQHFRPDDLRNGKFPTREAQDTEASSLLRQRFDLTPRVKTLEG
ncbi:hypothetical protein U1Q18_051453 [Sarracenia purpurea var. burkii]